MQFCKVITLYKLMVSIKKSNNINNFQKTHILNACKFSVKPFYFTNLSECIFDIVYFSQLIIAVNIHFTHIKAQIFFDFCI